MSAANRSAGCGAEGGRDLQLAPRPSTTRARTRSSPPAQGRPGRVLSRRAASWRVSRARPASAASSSSTSPSSLTLGVVVVGVCALGDDRQPAARLEGQLRQAGDRVDDRARSRRRASARPVRPAPGARAIASSGSISPKSTTSGLTGPPQRRAERDPALVEELFDLLELERGRAVAGSDEVAIEPCTSTTFARAAGAVQAVDVLRDHALEQAAPLELGQRLVGAIGPLVAERRGSAAGSRTRSGRGRARRRRCGRPPSGRRSPTAPSPGCGSRGSRTAPRSPPRSARRCARGLADRARASRSARWRRRPYLPLHFGRALAEEGADALLGVLAAEGGGEAAASRPRCPRRGRPCGRPA